MKSQDGGSVLDYSGKGATIVLLHGFLASSKYWQKLQPHLTKSGYRVIAIDLLGFGNAPKPHDATYTYDEHVAHVHKVIKQQGITEPFILIGHSMGALIAARYEAIHSSTIRSLILLHPPLYKDPHQAKATLRQTGRLYRFLLDSRFRRLGWMLIKTIAYEHIGRHSRAARELSMRNVIEKAEIFDDLQQINCKTMLIVGLRDREVYLDNLTAYRLSGAVTAYTEDVTHHSPLQAAQLIHQRIHQFIT